MLAYYVNSIYLCTIIHLKINIYIMVFLAYASDYEDSFGDPLENHSYIKEGDWVSSQHELVKKLITRGKESNDMRCHCKTYTLGSNGHWVKAVIPMPPNIDCGNITAQFLMDQFNAAYADFMENKINPNLKFD